jgi:uncharacterized membrane protein YoaK (UPF0700 family)
MSPIIQIAYGCLGAFVMEGFKLQKMYGTVEARKFKKLLRSQLYWAFTALTIILSGIISWIVNSNPVSPPTILQVFACGVAGRSIVFGLGAAVEANQGVTLGEDKNAEITLRDVLTA